MPVWKAGLASTSPIAQKDELPERGAQKLSRLDRNKDGIIDRKEFDAMSRRRGGGGGDWGKRLKAMDANKDGSVSKDEWKGRPEHFARLDSEMHELWRPAGDIGRPRWVAMPSTWLGKVTRFSNTAYCSRKRDEGSPSETTGEIASVDSTSRSTISK